MSAKTRHAFAVHCRALGHLTLLPPAIDLRGASTRPPPPDTATSLEARASHLERQAAAMLRQARELRAAAESQRHR